MQILCKQLPIKGKFRFAFENFNFFFPNIFDPWLVESADIGTADTKGQLCTDFTELLQKKKKKPYT